MKGNEEIKQLEKIYSKDSNVYFFYGFIIAIIPYTFLIIIFGLSHFHIAELLIVMGIISAFLNACCLQKLYKNKIKEKRDAN